MAWYRFPKHISTVTLDGNQFGVQFTDEAGERYTTAPDSYGKRLLDIGIVMAPPPEGAPEDTSKDLLPKEEVQKLADHVSGMKEENDKLRAMLEQSRKERDGLAEQLVEMKAELDDKDEELKAKAEALAKAEAPVPKPLVPVPPAKK